MIKEILILCAIAVLIAFGLREFNKSLYNLPEVCTICSPVQYTPWGEGDNENE